MVSNWREDLREIVDEIETKAEKKVKDTKGINNKVVINPKLDEAVKEIGGELLEVKEVDVDQKIKDREKEKEDEKKNKEDNAIKSLTPTGDKEDPSLKQKEKQANNMKKRVLLQKLRAVRSGAGDSIMASHEPEGEVIAEKDLNAAERRALPNKDFVFPGKGEGPEGKQRGAYPINDKKHARAALAMAAAHASPEKEAKVKAAVKKKYPDIEVSEATLMDKIKKWKGKKKPEKKATMDATTDKLHDWRQKNSPEQKEREKYVSPFRPIVKEGKGYQPEIEHSKLGDAKKKKDKERESKLPPHLQGDAIGKMKKAFATEGKKRGLWDNIHAKRKRGEKPAKPGDKDYPKTLNVEGLEKARKNVGADKCWDGYKAKGTKKKGGKEVPNCVKEEDKAFNFVLDKIRKEVGKDGYVSKDNPSKPQSAADKAKARAHQAKVDKENAAERAKDPSQGRYPKG